MPDQESDHLLAIARGLAARTPIDWAEFESCADDDSTRAAIRQMRIVARIADLYHTLPASPSPGADSDPQSASTGKDFPGPHQSAASREAWGGLVLVERIGQGSYGDVYRAWDQRLDREVALKLLRGDGADLVGSTVIEEGRLLARVRHPNVLTVHGADRIDGRVGVWMEFVRGRTLERRLRENGVLSAQDVVRIGSVLCRALAAVHDAGLLHRDIKAENVMLEEGGSHDGRLVLMDFGAGRDRHVEDRGAEVAGTPLYLAPEIFAGGRATPASDIYAVGVLLYHLLTGSYPIVGRTLGEIRERHRRSDRVALCARRADVPAALGDVINWALEIDPGVRFQTADEFARALSTIDPAADLVAVAAPRRLGIISWTMIAAVVGVGTAVGMNLARGSDHLIRTVQGLLGVPPSVPGAPPAIADPPRSFEVRRVLASGEYADVGRPSVDGRFLSFSDNSSDVVVKNLETGQVLQLTHGGAAVGFADGPAAISPDSREVAYPWLTPDQAFELRLASIDGTSEPRTLLRRTDEEVYPIEWSGDGTEILALVERTSTITIALVGLADGAVHPIPVPDVVRPQRVTLSPDGRFIAYDRPQLSRPRVRDIYVTAVDGSGTWPLVEHPANDLFPQWAPDGSRVFFASDRTGALGLWMARVADGRAIGEPEVISSDMGRMNPLGFTRAGAFYYHLRTGLVDAYTVAIDPQTEGIAARPDPVAPNYIGSNVSSAWSPDGREVAYVSIRSIARADRFSRTLSIRNLETGEERDLWPALAFFIMPQWSLDGRSILVRGNDLDGRCCLQQVDVASRRVTHIPLADSQATGHYQWQSGHSIVFARNGTIVSHDLFAGTEATIVDIHVLGLDRFSPPPHGRPFEISPDGHSLAVGGWVGSGSDSYSVILLVPSGGVPVELVRGHPGKAPKALFFQGWTRDGLDVLFTREEKDDAFSLWRVSVSGGQPKPLGLEMAGLRDVHMSPDGTRLTFTAGWETGEVRVMENFLPH